MSEKRVCQLLFLSLFLIGTYLPTQAQKIDTISVYSTSMKKQIKNIIILPASYTQNTQKKYPVAYLLHGYGGCYDTWATYTKPDLAQMASNFDMIIVCPDGLNSWYWDSPINPSYRYETYVSKELINYIDSQYRTYNNRKGRAITGFSMGGHGALWLAFRHPDTYGACGSISGGVDIRPFPENWEMKQLLGPYSENPQRWNEYTVINQLPYNSKSGPLAIIIDCGYYDFFYTVNQKLHEKLRYYNIPHDFLTRPGGHTHEYWNNAIDYQLLFFYKYFHPN